VVVMTASVGFESLVTHVFTQAEAV